MSVQNPAWMKESLCTQVDPDLFFNERSNQSVKIREAKKVCAGCDVIRDCAAYALDQEIEFGVWGGIDEVERRALIVLNNPSFGVSESIAS